MQQRPKGMRLIVNDNHAVNPNNNHSRNQIKESKVSIFLPSISKIPLSRKQAQPKQFKAPNFKNTIAKNIITNQTKHFRKS